MWHPRLSTTSQDDERLEGASVVNRGVVDVGGRVLGRAAGNAHHRESSLCLPFPRSHGLTEAIYHCLPGACCDRPEQEGSCRHLTRSSPQVESSPGPFGWTSLKPSHVTRSEHALQHPLRLRPHEPGRLTLTRSVCPPVYWPLVSFCAVSKDEHRDVGWTRPGGHSQSSTRWQHRRCRRRRSRSWRARRRMSMMSRSAESQGGLNRVPHSPADDHGGAAAKAGEAELTNAAWACRCQASKGGSRERAKRLNSQGSGVVWTDSRTGGIEPARGGGKRRR